MENHMFIVVTILCTILMIAITFINLSLGFQIVALWTFLMSVMLFGLYYLSRFANRFKLASYLFTSLSYIMMGGAYLLNSGSIGPSVYGFLLTFLIIVIITPKRTHLLWFSLHSIIVIALFLFELKWPDFITYQYDALESNRIIDLSFTYVPVLLFIYTIGVYVRKSYHHEKQLAEERLETINLKKVELEHLNSEKDRLFSIIGHDLRSPLHSIQGFLELINDPLLNDEDRKEIQTQLLDLTTNTSTLLNNLLLWSSNNDQTITLEEIELQTSIAEVANLIEPQAFKKKITINHVKNEVSMAVCGHEDMLQVVLRNILSNAIKFTPIGGVIEIWCTKNHSCVDVYVKDNGIGIPIDRQADLFSSRAKSTNGTQQESGIGLGLVLCHDFMKSMNGDIRFSSEEGQGSTFVLSLPLIQG